LQCAPRLAGDWNFPRTLTIRMDWMRERSRVAIHFVDNGPGISREDLDRLFDLFFTTKQMGTGLGLAVSCGIIKVHRGNTEIKRKLGEGCQVTVTLPLETA